MFEVSREGRVEYSCTQFGCYRYCCREYLRAINVLLHFPSLASSVVALHPVRTAVYRVGPQAVRVQYSSRVVVFDEAVGAAVVHFVICDFLGLFRVPSLITLEISRYLYPLHTSMKKKCPKY